MKFPNIIKDVGHNDDLIMCCVLFGLRTTKACLFQIRQTYFKELTDTDVRDKII